MPASLSSDTRFLECHSSRRTSYPATRCRISGPDFGAFSQNLNLGKSLRVLGGEPRGQASQLNFRSVNRRSLTSPSGVQSTTLWGWRRNDPAVIAVHLADTALGISKSVIERLNKAIEGATFIFEFGLFGDRVHNSRRTLRTNPYRD